MASSSSSPWMPSGRHPINIGASLGRALKARKNAAPVKTNKPETEFYSVRYNFKPESVDATKPGTVEVIKGKDTTSVNVVRASTQNDEGHLFIGNELPTREWDCVLIYDESTQTFRLEKLESFITLQYDRRTPHAPRHPGSPAPAVPQQVAPSTSSSSSNSGHRPHRPGKPEPDTSSAIVDDLEDEFEAAVNSSVIKNVTAPKPAKKSVSSRTASGTKTTHLSREVRKEEEEESEGEIKEDKPPPPRPAPVAVPPKPATQPPPATKPTTPLPPPKPISQPPPPSAGLPPRPSTLPAKVPPPSATPKPSGVAPKLKAKPHVVPPITRPSPTAAKGPNKRELPAEIEQETLEINRPAPPPAKKPRVTLPEKKPAPEKESKDFSLALPGAGVLASLPSPIVAAPPSLSFPGSRSAVPMPTESNPLPISALQADSDEDDEWDEVQPPTTVPASAALPPRTIVMEEIDPAPSAPLPVMDIDEDEGMEEIDMNAFAAELAEEMEEADPGIVGEADEEDDFLLGAVSPVAERQPSPVFGAGSDEDDYSSSDDSDDD